MPRPLHQAGCAAIAGTALVLMRAREALAAVDLDLNRTVRELTERGEAHSARVVAQALQVARGLADDLVTRRGAVLELARDFRACDDELTPARSPSQSAIQAFRSAQEFAERGGAALKGGSK